MRTRVVLGAGLALLVAVVGASRVRATSCAIPYEVLTLQIRDVTVDGVAQGLDAYAGMPAEMKTGADSVSLSIGGTRFYYFHLSATCGYALSTNASQPTTPPANSMVCAPNGLHCHWPAAGPTCSGRCAGGSWEVSGCPAP